ncbi:MAG: glycosyltransferase family 39 protein [Methanobacterium sp.]|nr:glycosyltransferase family 39 protein [Methanobacterium sp.]
MMDKFNLSSFNPRNSDLIISAVLTLLIVITRLPFVSKYLYEWDSVNYAIGFENFNILNHQPHPPGYIFYVYLGRGINTFFNDPNNTMIFISILFSVLTVLLIYFLAKQMFSRQIAIIASILLVFNPLFWYYGEIATIYPSEAFFATLIAYMSYMVFKGNEKYFYPSALVLGLAGGFRQDLIIFMFPLWFFCLFYNKREPLRLLKAILVLIPSVLVWFIPTIILSGGYEQYSQASATLYKMCFPRTSLLFGSSIANRLSDLGAFTAWTGLALTFAGIIIMALFHKYVEKGPLHLFKENMRDYRVMFLVLWFLPASIIYLLIHLAKPGYMLVFVPALAIVIACFVKGLAYGLNNKIGRYSPKKWISIILVAVILFNTAYFAIPYNQNEEKLWETPLGSLNPFEGILWGIDTSLIYNNQKIVSNDHNTQIYLDSISQVPGSNSNNTIIVMGEISRVNEGFNWRKAMYYLPNYPIYYLIEADNYIVSPWYGENHTNIWLDSNIFKIPVNKSTEKIIWIISNESAYFSQITSQIPIKTINLANGQKIYYSDIKDQKINNNELVFNGPKQA